MADKTGYVGRNPNDSAVVLARQFFTASGVTTTFTFASGYLTGYLDIYVDGVKRRVADEFTATDGATFDVLQGGVSAGSTVEAVAYKAFNAAATVGDVTGNFNVSGNTTLDGSLSVTGGTTLSNINVTGIATLGAGTTVAFANTAFNLSGTPDITIASLSAVDINVSGAATIGGILTYEDVTNIDSVGIVTARTGVEVTANGLVVNAGVSTFAADVSIADKIVHTGDTNTAIRFPSADTITAETAGVERVRIDSNGDVGLVGIATATGLVVVAGSGVYAGHTGVVTAVTFDGNVTGNISGGTVAGSTGTFTGDVDIADKIVHTGDTNTAIRFPAADTFTVETGGTEAYRVDSSQRLLVGTDTTITDTNFGIGKLQATNKDGYQHVLFSGHSASAANATALSVGRSRGSQSSPGYLSSGDHIARFSAISYNGGNYQSSGSIDFYAADQHASNDLPGHIVFNTVPDGSATLTERVRITSAGLVGIGSETPARQLEVFGDRTAYLRLGSNRAGAAQDEFIGGIEFFSKDASGPGAGVRGSIEQRTSESDGSGSNMVFRTGSGSANNVEAARIDSSGRLLINTTSVIGGGTNSLLHLVDASGPEILLGRNDSTTAADDDIGKIRFFGNDGGSYQETATISAQADLDHANNDKPGRLVFSTTADGASSVTERLRITNDGTVRIVADNQKLTLGAGNDFELYHDGTDNVIATDGANIRIGTSGESFAKFVNNGAAELYHDNSKTFETTSTGALVQRPTGDVSLSIGDTTNSDGHLVLTAKSSSVELHGRSNHPINILFNTVQKASIGIDGTISDNIGPLRRLGTSNEGSSRALATSDTGKFLRINATSVALSVPSGTFTAGDMISFFNVSTGDMTVTSSAVTVYNAADGDTGNTRTIAAKGMATLLCTASDEFVISGTQLT